MEKVKLTQEEKKQIKELNSIRIKVAELNMKYQKKAGDFWYDFQKRMGYGNFKLDVRKGAVYERGLGEDKLN